VKPVLVLGIGNILLRDEGIGVRVVEALADQPLPPEVELLDGGTAGGNLVDVLADRRKAVIIDAIADDVAPGTVFRLTPDDLIPAAGEMLSMHQVGLVESLHMARQLGCLPAEVVIFGVQPHSISPGLELSPELQRRVPAIVQVVLDELASSPKPTACRSGRATS